MVLYIKDHLTADVMEQNMFGSFPTIVKITSNVWLSIRSFLIDLFCATYTT